MDTAVYHEAKPISSQNGVQSANKQTEFILPLSEALKRWKKQKSQKGGGIVMVGKGEIGDER